MNASNEATLGVVLDTTGLAAEVTVQGARLSVIGYVGEPTTELVAVDSDGTVWSYSPSGGTRMPLNSSVDALRRFLDLFEQFFAVTDAPPPATYTAEQMAEKLAAFRRRRDQAGGRPAGQPRGSRQAAQEGAERHRRTRGRGRLVVDHPGTGRRRDPVKARSPCVQGASAASVGIQGFSRAVPLS
ncbi:SUKH-4 family immunity protein [Phytohabitans aurantiacus]|uniref:SUKH-4 immunity protein of toxin-antitoxin system n=1 Tax=Phytohabitans aurantiacus TaxID=3016789 RepID=A0ABQ5QQY3_9ACTN|nr:SUKH-4 family immunity protein [Phytohabitans aurantiacus]GLH96382.1 hypothetical protein Pa4123_16560 [Phytohabitans aurantiacus]